MTSNNIFLIKNEQLTTERIVNITIYRKFKYLKCQQITIIVCQKMY